MWVLEVLVVWLTQPFPDIDSGLVGSPNHFWPWTHMCSKINWTSFPQPHWVMWDPPSKTTFKAESCESWSTSSWLKPAKGSSINNKAWTIYGGSGTGTTKWEKNTVVFSKPGWFWKDSGSEKKQVQRTKTRWQFALFLFSLGGMMWPIAKTGALVKKWQNGRIRKLHLPTIDSQPLLLEYVSFRERGKMVDQWNSYRFCTGSLHKYCWWKESCTSWGW